MVNLSSRQWPTQRSFDDFSYIDEMESLFLKPGIDIDRYLKDSIRRWRRHCLTYVLSLGGNHYMS